MELYPKNGEIRSLLDRMQIQLECCGAVSQEDWYTIGWYDKKNTDEPGASVNLAGHVPFSCCSKDVVHMPCIHHGLSDKSYKYKYDENSPSTLWTKGCGEAYNERYCWGIYILSGILALLSTLAVLGAAGDRLLQTADSYYYLQGAYTGWIFGEKPPHRFHSSERHHQTKRRSITPQHVVKAVTGPGSDVSRIDDEIVERSSPRSNTSSSEVPSEQEGTPRKIKKRAKRRMKILDEAMKKEANKALVSPTSASPKKTNRRKTILEKLSFLKSRTNVEDPGSSGPRSPKKVWFNRKKSPSVGKDEKITEAKPDLKKPVKGILKDHVETHGKGTTTVVQSVQLSPTANPLRMRESSDQTDSEQDGVMFDAFLLPRVKRSAHLNENVSFFPIILISNLRQEVSI